MHPSRWVFLSAAWRPHAALLQGLIAGASSDPSQLRQARVYLCDLPVDDAVNDADDAMELLQLMHRAAYPADSHLEARAAALLAAGADQLTPRQVAAVCRHAAEDPRAAAMWTRVAVRQPWFAAAAARLAALPLAEHIAAAAAIWRRGGNGSPPADGGAAAAARPLARRVAAGGREAAAAVRLCARVGIPRPKSGADGLDGLRRRLLETVRGGLDGPRDTADVADGLAQSRSVDGNWVRALCRGLRGQEDAHVGTREERAAAALAILRAAATASEQLAVPDEEMDAVVAEYVAVLSREDVAACGEVAAAFASESLPQLRAALQKRLAMDTPSHSRTSDGRSAGDTSQGHSRVVPLGVQTTQPKQDVVTMKEEEEDEDEVAGLWRIRAMVSLDPSAAVKMLTAYAETVAASVNSGVSTPCPITAVSLMARCMHDLGVAPPALVARCGATVMCSANITTLASGSTVSSSSGALSLDDTAALLLAAARCGERADSDLFVALMGRVASARNARSFGRGENRRPVLSVRGVAAVLKALALAPGGRTLWAVHDTEKGVRNDKGTRLAKCVGQMKKEEEEEKKLADKEGSASLRLALRRAVADHTHVGLRPSDATALIRLVADLRANAKTPSDRAAADAPLETALLAAAARDVSSLSPEEAAVLCETLADLGARDAMVLRALASRVAAGELGRASIVRVAVAARRLRLVPHFQRSPLPARVTTLDGWEAADIAVVASACDGAQRHRLLQLPGADRLAKASPDALHTRDLFLRLALLGPEAASVDALHARNPLAAGELEVADVRRALRHAAPSGDTKAVAAICRAAAETLRAADESELMSLLDTVKAAPQLPNAFFRVVGNAVRRVAGGMTVENAVQWLRLYMAHEVRDDSIGRVLLSRARMRGTKASITVDRAIKEAAAFFGRALTERRKTRKAEERLPWADDARESAVKG